MVSGLALLQHAGTLPTQLDRERQMWQGNCEVAQAEGKPQPLQTALLQHLEWLERQGLSQPDEGLGGSLSPMDFLADLDCAEPPLRTPSPAPPPPPPPSPAAGAMHAQASQQEESLLDEPMGGGGGDDGWDDEHEPTEEAQKAYAAAPAASARDGQWVTQVIGR